MVLDVTKRRQTFTGLCRAAAGGRHRERGADHTSCPRRAVGASQAQQRRPESAQAWDGWEHPEEPKEPDARSHVGTATLLRRAESWQAPGKRFQKFRVLCGP